MRAVHAVHADDDPRRCQPTQRPFVLESIRNTHTDTQREVMLRPLAAWDMEISPSRVSVLTSPSRVSVLTSPSRVWIKRHVSLPSADAVAARPMRHAPCASTAHPSLVQAACVACVDARLTTHAVCRRMPLTPLPHPHACRAWHPLTQPMLSAMSCCGPSESPRATAHPSLIHACAMRHFRVSTLCPSHVSESHPSFVCVVTCPNHVSESHPHRCTHPESAHKRGATNPGRRRAGCIR